jgi:acyl carrier protein
MDEVSTKLERCFLTVFPGISPEKIQTADSRNMPKWDSIAQVTLLSLIGEEFRLPIDFGEFADACSFPEILQILESKLKAS